MAGLGPALHDFGWCNTKSRMAAPDSQRKNRTGMTRTGAGMAILSVIASCGSAMAIRLPVPTPLAPPLRA